MHPGSFREGEWEAVTNISEIEFELSFSLRGPVGDEGRVVR